MDNANKAEAAYKLALKHHQAGRLDDAVREYARTIRLSPYSPDAYNNFGVALRAMGKPHGAIACYRRSLSIRPRAAGVLTNLGNAFRDLGMVDQATVAHTRALKLAPESAKAQFNAGLAYRDSGHVTQALEHFQKSLALDPGNHNAKLEMGISLLVAGEWNEGFQLFESRLKLPQLANKRKSIPIWKGPDSKDGELNGRTILITSEGSIGTQIMMSRFARNLKLSGAKVIMEASPNVAPLLGLSPDIDEVINIGNKATGADYQIPLLSIPAKLGINLSNVPAETPYLRAPITPPKELDIEPGIKLAIGIVWSQADGKTEIQARRNAGNCRLEELMEIVALPGLRVFSLVHGTPRKEIYEIGVQEIITDIAPKGGDMAALAGIIEQLDMVITVDGAIAHLAGSLGKPVWLMVAPGGDWCWLLERKDSPWYPSMRVFRKEATQNWQELATSVRKSLQNILMGSA